MVYLGLNADYLPPTRASGYYLPGGPKNHSTQKVITYSDSTQIFLQDNVFCFHDQILNLVTKVAQAYPKSDQLLFSMQTGKCHPYEPPWCMAPCTGHSWPRAGGASGTPVGQLPLTRLKVGFLQCGFGAGATSSTS